MTWSTTFKAVVDFKSHCIITSSADSTKNQSLSERICYIETLYIQALFSSSIFTHIQPILNTLSHALPYPVFFWNILYPGTDTAAVTIPKEQCPRTWLQANFYGETFLLGNNWHRICPWIQNSSNRIQGYPSMHVSLRSPLNHAFFFFAFSFSFTHHLKVLFLL